jgi:Icc-related predicted phosphoesterase
MVKLNEALLVGGSLLVALVLSKGGDFYKNFSMPQNSANGLAGPIAEPTILPEIEVYQQQKAIVDIPTLPTYEKQFDFTGNEILTDILDQEKSIRDKKIAAIQTELDKTNEFIASQNEFTQPEIYNKYFAMTSGKKAILYRSAQTNIINTYGEVTDENIIKYVDKLLEDPRNRNPTSQKFPVIPQGLSNLYNSIIEKQNRAKAQQFADTQQAEISNILNEYDTRFGGLSRYG